MNCVLIGAHLPEYTLLNNHRQHMLENALRTSGFEFETGYGFDGEYVEPICAVKREMGDSVVELADLAKIFEQSYIMVIENDRAFIHDLKAGDFQKIGVMWKCDKFAPPAVRLNVKKGLDGNPAGGYTIIDGEIFGIDDTIY